MNRIVGLSGMKNLDQFRSLLSGSVSGAAKTYSNSGPSGSFANLKLTAGTSSKSCSDVEFL